MSQQRQFQMVGGNYNGGQLMNDTTYTKLFVGGLAWETQRETMKKYFEQFGEILEAVVITDKASGRSKGYGFVTFKDPEAAFRACQNPSPVIDGRRANCNLASLGAQKKGPTTPPHVSSGRFRSGAPGLMTTPYPGSSSSTYLHQSYPQPPYSAYGYTGYSHDTMYHMNTQNYYGLYGQQFSPYYPTSGAAGAGGSSAGTIGYFHNLYPYYAPYPQSSQAHAFGVQYPQMVQQYPFLPQHFNSSSGGGILSLPTSTTVAISSTTPTGLTATTVGAIAGSGSAPSQTNTTGATFEQNSSA